jgi:Zn-dependent protease with chaperone function
MTDATGIPTARPRTVLTDIAPVSWEHPADRAALQALRAVPGFDQAVKSIVGFFGERGIRLMFQANAVKVGPKQFPTIHSLMSEVKTTLDWPDDVEVFISQTPLVNAGAVGVDEPFIVLNSGAVSLLDDDEVRVLLGHELGHVMSGHALYHTILLLLLELGFQNLPFLAGIALLPIKLALLEWYRKSELSADRAGLLSSQNREETLRVYLKLAGGGKTSDMDLEAFMEQARDYEESGGALDTIYKILNTLAITHPFNTLRAAELQRWIDARSYQQILDGEYTRRSDARPEERVGRDVAEGAGYYAKEAKETVQKVTSEITSAAKKAAQAFSEAFKNDEK